MIRNVLVAVDGSEYSDRTLFALDLSEKYKAAVTVFNVSESPAVEAIPWNSQRFQGGSFGALSGCNCKIILIFQKRLNILTNTAYSVKFNEN